MCLEVIQQLKHYKVFVIIRVFTTTKIPVKKQNYKHGRCTFNLKKKRDQFLRSVYVNLHFSSSLQNGV